MGETQAPRSVCPINATVEVFGDRSATTDLLSSEKIAGIGTSALTLSGCQVASRFAARC
jgi:hypothetical protein